MRPYPVFLSAVLILCIALVSSCKPAGEGSGKSAAAGSSSPESTLLAQEPKVLTAEQAAERNLSPYVGAFNSLVDHERGLPETYRSFMRGFRNARQLGNQEFPVVENLAQTITTLQLSLLTRPPGEEQLNVRATELIDALEVLLASEKEMVAIYGDREDQADIMAKARPLLARLQSDYEKALLSLSRLGDEIMRSRRQIAEKRMEQFREVDNMIAYHTEEIMILSEEILALFDDPKVPFNRAVNFSRGNILVVRMDNAIRALRRATDEARAKGDKVNPYFDAIRNRASGIIADYREVRDRRSQTAFVNMLKKFDLAIQDYKSAQIAAMYLDDAESAAPG